MSEQTKVSLDSLKLSSSVKKTLQEATEAYSLNLAMLESTLTARGISGAAASSFRLGVVTEPVVPEHQRFLGMMSIPYLTPAGTVAMKFRCIAHPGKCEGHEKYNAPAGQTTRLYNVAALHSPGEVVAVCEGEMDAVVMTTVVGIPAVGVPGASAWKEHWSRCFADYDRVLIVADNDLKDDGKNPGLRHAERVVEKTPGAELVLPPAGLDLSEWVEKEGAETVREVCGAW